MGKGITFENPQQKNVPSQNNTKPLINRTDVPRAESTNPREEEKPEGSREKIGEDNG